MSEIDRGLLIELYRKYAVTSSSFLSLYSGFKYFYHERVESGVIAYVETPFSWVAAGDPIADPNHFGVLIEAFKKKAQLARKSVLVLPASHRFTEIARQHGFQPRFIGAEPWNHIASDFYKESQLIKKINPARQLSTKGAQIEEFKPSDLSSEASLELQNISRMWLESRKSDPLGFLNRLEPWSLSEHKRYYWIKFSGKIQGYLAAVPVWSSNSWYLVDLVRMPDSVLGTTELLVIGAMERLSREGASRVTLGFSPLAKLEMMDDDEQNCLYAKITRLLFKSSSLGYSFRSLFEYKEKFQPDVWERQYLLIQKDRSLLIELLSLGYALYPDGMLKLTWGVIKRGLKGVHLFRWFSNQLSKSLVARPTPNSTGELIQRCKATFFLQFVSLLIFVLSSDEHGVIREKMLNNYGFSTLSWLQNPMVWDEVKKLFVSPFLFFDFNHFWMTSLLSSVLLGTIELFIGTTFALKVYLPGVYLTLVLSGLFDFLIAQIQSLFFQGATLAVLIPGFEIGPYYGIAACVGALSYFLLKKPGVMVTFFIAVSAPTLYFSASRFLPEVIAFLIGFFISKRTFPLN